MFSNIILLDFFANTACWPWWLLWTLGAMLLGGLLHRWLFCKDRTAEIETLTKERDGYHAKLTSTEKDLASFKYQLDEANKDNMALRNAVSRCEGDKAGLEAKLAAAVAAAAEAEDSGATALGIAGGTMTKADADDGGSLYASVLGTDNLQIIEGIGPKIDGLMKEGGITDWEAMSKASVEDLQAILTAAGSRYRLADPKTWPQQAKLAHEGKWEELIALQKALDTGKETVAEGHTTPAKVEKLIAKLLGYSTNPNDLKVVEGIGPKIEGLLKDAGIMTWSDLAAAATERLQEILTAAGDRYRLADPTTWAKQAALAAEGKWDELRQYQEFLDGGKTPS